MKNRKKINQQIDKKKKNKRLVSTLITCVVILAIAAGIGWIAFDSIQTRHVLTFEGRRVPANEIYYHALNAQERMTQQLGFPVQLNLANHDDFTLALNEMIRHESIVHQLNLAGLSPSDDMMEEALFIAEANHGLFHPSLPQQRIAELIAELGMLEELANHLLPDFNLTIDELREDFDIYFEENREFFELEATEVLFISTPDRAALENIADLHANADEINFAAFIPGVHIGYDPEVGISPIPLSLFIFQPDIADYFDELSTMEEGDISSIINIGVNDDGEEIYMLVYMSAWLDMDINEIETEFVEWQSFTRREDAFFDMIESWRDTADYTINSRLVPSA